MDLEATIAEAERLVKLAKQTANFVEVELNPALLYIFNHSDSVVGELLSRVRYLFMEIVGIQKAALGFILYSELQKSDFPFAEDVLRNAATTDPDPNGRNSALGSYVAVALRNANIQGEVTYNLLRPILRTYHDDYLLLKEVGDSRPSQTISIPDELKENLLMAASIDGRFESTRRKALSALVYFDIKEIVPTLIKSLEKYTQGEFNYNLATELASTATALKYLTQDKRYSEVIDIFDREGNLPIRDRYGSAFISKVRTRVQEILTTSSK